MDNNLGKKPSKIVYELNEDIKNIDRQVIITGMMVLMLCIAFFFLGYYAHAKISINECNEFIVENNLKPCGIVHNEPVTYNFSINLGDET